MQQWNFLTRASLYLGAFSAVNSQRYWKLWSTSSLEAINNYPPIGHKNKPKTLWTKYKELGNVWLLIINYHIRTPCTTSNLSKKIKNSRKMKPKMKIASQRREKGEPWRIKLKYWFIVCTWSEVKSVPPPLWWENRGKSEF